MNIETAEQFEALSRLKRVERVQRLRTIAKGSSWLHGRMLFLAAVVCGIACVTILPGVGGDRAIAWMAYVALFAVAGLAESLGRRIDAVLELLDLDREASTADALRTVSATPIEPQA